MTQHEYDIPIIRGTFSIRSPRAVALLQPVLVPIILATLVVSIVFTIAPETLNHSPISFENRGIIHHIWHYALLAGSLLATAGLFVVHRRRLQIELSGLCLLIGVFTMNLVALISGSFDPTEDPPSGFGMAIRAGIIVGFLIRAYTLVREPTVQIPGTKTNKEG